MVGFVTRICGLGHARLRLRLQYRGLGVRENGTLESPNEIQKEVGVGNLRQKSIKKSRLEPCESYESTNVASVTYIQSVTTLKLWLARVSPHLGTPGRARTHEAQGHKSDCL